MKSEERLSEAAARLVARRAKKAKKNVGLAAKGDVDGVHDLRVAVRKLRAAISVLRGATIGEDALDKEDKALSKLFSALGDARDDDVMLERITTLAKRRRLDAKAIRKLTEVLADARKRARKRLRRMIEKTAPKKLFARLAKKVAEHAAAPIVLGSGDDVPRILVRHFASSVLFARWECVLAYETALPASVGTLHRLRIAIKKLRYAVDFFAEALGAHATALDKPLGAAQDALGDLHDHDVARRYVSAQGGEESAVVVEAEDKDAERILARFDVAWREISGDAFARLLGDAAHAMLAPPAAATLAVRRL